VFFHLLCFRRVKLPLSEEIVLEQNSCLGGDFFFDDDEGDDVDEIFFLSFFSR
jgi:hypothetical protein